MQVPMKNPSVRMGSMPNVSAGPMTDASGASFGANRYRQLGQLAGAVGDAGNALLAEAQRRQKKEDTLFHDKAVNDMHIRYRDGIQAIYDECKSEKAVEAPKRVAEFMQKMQHDIDRSLQNPMQREMFSRSFQAFSTQTQKEAFVYRDKEVAASAVTQSEAKIELMIEDSNETLLGEDGIRKVLDGPSMSFVLSEIDKITEGQPPEARELARRRATQKVHQRRLKDLSVADPNKALEYLNDPEVSGSMPTAMVKQLRDQYTVAVVNNDINTMAMDLADQTMSGAMTEAGERITSAYVQRLAYEKFPDDPNKPDNAKSRETLLNVYDNHLTRLKSAKQTDATMAKQAMTEKFMKVNFELGAMSPDEQAAILSDDNLYQTWTRFQKWKGGEDTNPDYEWIFQQEQMTSTNFKAWLNEPKSELKPYSNFEVFLRKTGGNKEIINRLFKHALADTEGGESGFFGAAKFDPTRFFRNSYGEKYKSTTMIFWESPENFWNEDTSIAQFRNNGWLEIYNHNLAAKEAELKRKANYFEQEAVAQETWRAIKDNNIDLDKSYWVQRPDRDAASGTAASPVETQVDADTLPFEKRRFNRGEPTVRLSPAAGAPVGDFGRIAPDDTRQLSPDIIDYKAKDVLRAYQPGEIGDLEYAADDLIVYGRHDEIVVFDGMTGTMKSAPLLEVLPSNKAAEVQARAEQAELERIGVRNDAEAELNGLRNRKRELEREFDKMFGNRQGRHASMARLHHKKRMKDIDREIAESEMRLKRLSGGGQ